MAGVASSLPKPNDPGFIRGPTYVPGGPGSPTSVYDASRPGSISGDNLRAPGAAEDYYNKTQNFYTSPTNAQTMFNAGQGQLNPYYDYAYNQGVNSINQQFGAQGGFNSGARLAAVADLGANLRGQQAKNQIDLGLAADQSNLSRVQGGESAAATSDAGKVARFSALENGALGLANGESGAQSPYYTNASQFSNPYYNEGIQSDINKASIYKSSMNDLGSGASGFLKLLAA